MKNGPFVFVGGLIALLSAWGALVMGPVVQLGSLDAHTDQNTGQTYPVNRSGEAVQGAEVYRSLGCNQCHTRFATQDELWFGARITKPTTNSAALVDALLTINPNWTKKEASDLLDQELPIQVVSDLGPFWAGRAVELLKQSDSEAELTVHNHGTDLDRGWGKRQSVSRDYLLDNRALMGSLRVGPDLGNIGVRDPAKFVGAWSFTAPETNLVARASERANWHLVHLYNPKVKVPESTMPSYRFLFEERETGKNPSVDALELPEKFAPAAGREIVPTAAAKALVTWLLSQRNDVSLPEAPIQAPFKPAPEKTAETAEGAEAKQ